MVHLLVLSFYPEVYRFQQLVCCSYSSQYGIWNLDVSSQSFLCLSPANCVRYVVVEGFCLQKLDQICRSRCVHPQSWWCWSTLGLSPSVRMILEIHDGQPWLHDPDPSMAILPPDKILLHISSDLKESFDIFSFPENQMILLKQPSKSLFDIYYLN